MAEVRQFETGATRDQDTTKYDYEGFFPAGHGPFCGVHA